MRKERTIYEYTSDWSGKPIEESALHENTLTLNGYSVRLEMLPEESAALMALLLPYMQAGQEITRTTIRNGLKVGKAPWAEVPSPPSKTKTPAKAPEKPAEPLERAPAGQVPEPARRALTAPVGAVTTEALDDPGISWSDYEPRENDSGEAAAQKCRRWCAHFGIKTPNRGAPVLALRTWREWYADRREHWLPTKEDLGVKPGSIGAVLHEEAQRAMAS